jgi:hypothetical protein
MMAMPGHAVGWPPAEMSISTAVTAKGVALRTQRSHPTPSAEVSQYRTPARSRSRTQRWATASYGSVSRVVQVPATCCAKTIVLSLMVVSRWLLTSTARKREVWPGGWSAWITSRRTSESVRSYVTLELIPE